MKKLILAMLTALMLVVPISAHSGVLRKVTNVIVITSECLFYRYFHGTVKDYCKGQGWVNTHVTVVTIISHTIATVGTMLIDYLFTRYIYDKYSANNEEKKVSRLKSKYLKWVYNTKE